MGAGAELVPDAGFTCKPVRKQLSVQVLQLHGTAAFGYVQLATLAS